MEVDSSQQIRHQYTSDYFLMEVGGWKDFSAGKISSEKEMSAKQLDFEGKFVLDVGFGRGEILWYVLANGASKATGLDFSSAACEIAGKFLNEKGMGGRAHLYNIPIEDLWTVEEKGFECIYMLDILEHVMDWEIFAFLSQLQQKAAQTATLFASTPAVRGGGKMHCNYQSEANLRRLFLPFWAQVDIVRPETDFILKASGPLKVPS
jgi:2-polyprenyl-3-methyl-5-hydroxy-6-metoxy-1,4-benzoquinol methylase